MRRTFHVYMLANRSRTLYTGVTGDIERRLYEHKRGLTPGFAQRYRIDRLVYVECHASARDAIAREKQLKGWLRARKVALVKESNPHWTDLSAAWFGDAEQAEECPGEPGAWTDT